MSFLKADWNPFKVYKTVVVGSPIYFWYFF